MAQQNLEALITRIQAAARTGDAPSRRAWYALIALQKRIGEDQQFDRNSRSG